MATKKVLEVDETSIVDLKAELFRKEQQFRKESDPSAKPKTRTTDSKKKPPVWGKQTKNTTNKSKTQQPYHEGSTEEENAALQKSRRMLEAKAALYEKMAKGEIEENEDETETGEEGRFLVDFHKKNYNEVIKQKMDEEESEDIGPPTPPPSGPEEEWVDYIDSLGRSRKCLKKDLKELQERDREFIPKKSPSPPTLLSDDMRREIMRKKWEEEEEEARNRPVGPVHYQNIQFDEVRNHGVGYYQFSKVEQERQQQMETLKKLREETLDQRSRIEKIKDRRKAALEARLAKVRARKKLKTGEDFKDDEVSPLTQDKNTEETENKNTEDTHSKNIEEVNKYYETRENTFEKVNIEPDERAEKISKRKTQLPEWARHKIAQPDIGKAYLKKRREERFDDFAPPSFYYETTSNNLEKTDRNISKGREGSKMLTQTNEAQSSFDESKTRDAAAREIQNQETQQKNSNINQPSAWPQYPPHPPPLSDLLPPLQRSEQGHQIYPPLPLPPQDISQFSPSFPPFPPQYSGMMPPALQPPWLPAPWQQSPWQQFPGQQDQVPFSTPQSNDAFSQTKKQNEFETGSEVNINSKNTSVNQDSSSTTNDNIAQIPSSDMMSVGNLATTDVNRIVADFVSSLRPKS